MTAGALSMTRADVLNATAVRQKVITLKPGNWKVAGFLCFTMLNYLKLQLLKRAPHKVKTKYAATLPRCKWALSHKITMNITCDRKQLKAVT